MTKDEALKMIKVHDESGDIEDLVAAYNACKEALEQPAQEPKCSEHPDAPHGFCRDASHSADRYVCECEGWEAEQPEPRMFLDLSNSNGNHPIEQPAKEPVAWVSEDVLKKQFVEGRPRRVWYECNKGVGLPLYTHPAPSWQGLTAKEIASIPLNEYTVQTVERILKEKNNV